MISGVCEELCDLWVADFGTEPPSFGGDSIWKFSGELRSMRWEDSVVWAERINGRPLLPGQIRKLQKLHGFDGFPSDRREAVLRRAGNGAERTVRAGRGVIINADRDTGRNCLQNIHGNWGRVNGRRDLNWHNQQLADQARRLRLRVLRYCATAEANAARLGVGFDFKRVFKAACGRVFGSPQPYRNGSRVKAFRDWVAAELARKNVTHPPGAALNGARGAMGYGDTSPKRDLRKITHLPGTAGAPTEEKAGEAGPMSAEPLSTEAQSVCLRGCRHEPEPPSGLQLLVKAKVSPPALLGLASSALPTLAEAHEGHDRLSWDNHRQRGWAKGWLNAWLVNGRSVKQLVALYLDQLARHDERARASGFGRGQFAPWGFRKRLQRGAEALPVVMPEHFAANPSRFNPTRSQIAVKAAREERRARAAAERELRGRVRRKSPAQVERMMREAGFEPVAVEPVAVETSPWEDEMADYHAESAAAAMDRRMARRARENRIREADAWQRDLGNA